MVETLMSVLVSQLADESSRIEYTVHKATLAVIRTYSWRSLVFISAHDRIEHWYMVPKATLAMIRS